MKKFTALRSQADKEGVKSNGIILCMYQKGQDVPEGIDITYPYIILSLNISGSAHCQYDMKDIVSHKNDLTVFLPGHIIRPLEYSEDYAQAWLLFDPSKFADSELKFNEKDLKLLYQAPICHLTEEQAANLLSIARVIDYIASRTEKELPKKHRMLEAQLSLAYELYISIRHRHDLEWGKDRMGHVYLQFCDLVVAHYKKERNVNYYARLLGYDQRYFSKVFKVYNNGTSPLAWIQQYITSQAKRIMSENPRQTVKATALQLGFPTTANFCRYFKRSTGMTPNEWQQMTK